MTQVFETYSDFLNRSEWDVNGVSKEFALNNPKFEKENKLNKGCWNCSDCSDLRNASPIKHSENAPNAFPETPVIENIHSKILEATTPDGALKMDLWHTYETTHCRAGWVVTLAGKEGKELESRTSTLFAAMQIYKKSSDIRVFPPRFFESNKIAMDDIKRCAKEELDIKN